MSRYEIEYRKLWIGRSNRHKLFYQIECSMMYGLSCSFTFIGAQFSQQILYPLVFSRIILFQSLNQLILVFRFFYFHESLLPDVIDGIDTSSIPIHGPIAPLTPITWMSKLFLLESIANLMLLIFELGEQLLHFTCQRDSFISLSLDLIRSISFTAI